MKKLWFLDIPKNLASDPDAEYYVLPLAYEKTVTFGKGTGEAPEAILKASHEVEDFDEHYRRAYNFPVYTLSVMKFNKINQNKAMDLIYTKVLKIIENKKFLLSLGGEHTISFPIIKAISEIYKKLYVICFDAHLDLRNSYQNNPFSHACVMRRVRETGAFTIHIGARSWSLEEECFSRNNNVSIISAESCINFFDEALKRLNDILPDNRYLLIYLSIDVDVLDPSIMQGTGTPEPGGLNWFQLLCFVEKLMSCYNVVAVDIVETIPLKESVTSQFISARLGAKVIMMKHIFKSETSKI